MVSGLFSSTTQGFCKATEDIIQLFHRLSQYETKTRECPFKLLGMRKITKSVSIPLITSLSRVSQNPVCAHFFTSVVNPLCIPLSFSVGPGELKQVRTISHRHKCVK